MKEMLLEFDNEEYSEALDYVRKNQKGELAARLCGWEDSEHFLQIIIGRPNIVYDGATIMIHKTGDDNQTLPFYVTDVYHLVKAGTINEIQKIESGGIIHVMYDSAQLTVDSEGWLSVFLRLIDGTICQMTYIEFSGYNRTPVK